MPRYRTTSRRPPSSTYSVSPSTTRVTYAGPTAVCASTGGAIVTQASSSAAPTSLRRLTMYDPLRTTARTLSRRGGSCQSTACSHAAAAAPDPVEPDDLHLKLGGPRHARLEPRAIVGRDGAEHPRRLGGDDLAARIQLVDAQLHAVGCHAG